MGWKDHWLKTSYDDIISTIGNFLNPRTATPMKKARGLQEWQKRDTCICTVSECRWAGALFGWPCWSVHGSGRVCPGSGGSWQRPSGMDSGKPAFMSGAPRPASSSLGGLSPEALTLLGGARFIAWRMRPPEAFLCLPDGSGLRSWA